jgi:hypothetical protein
MSYNNFHFDLKEFQVSWVLNLSLYTDGLCNSIYVNVTYTCTLLACNTTP